MSSSLLMAAIRARLLSDPDLATRFPGLQIHDRTPASAPFPYLVFGASDALDWSTSDERGHEHLLALNVWSKRAGRAEALDIAERVSSLLHCADLDLGGPVLVLLRVVGLDTAITPDGKSVRATVRLRALTEQPIPGA